MGLEVHQSPKGLFINQHKYATDLIELTDLLDSSPVDTPLKVNLKLSKDDGDLLPDPHTGDLSAVLSISPSPGLTFLMLSILSANL